MQRVGQVGLVLVKGPIWVVILVVPHVELSEGSGFDTEEPSGGEGWKGKAVPGDLRGAQRHWLRGAAETIDEEAQQYNSFLWRSAMTEIFLNSIQYEL